MRKIVRLTVFLLCCALSSDQSNATQVSNTRKPDLSGTWILEYEEDTSGHSKRHTPGQVEVTIVHRDPEITITRLRNSRGQQTSQESTYYSDDRGEQNLGPGFSTKPTNARDEVTKSRTKWNKDRLTIEANIRKTESGSTLSVKIIDEWKLSKDGKTLTQTTSYYFDGIDFEALKGRGVIIPARPKGFTKVFRRAP